MDVGGTFTDCFALSDGSAELRKVPTRRDDPAAAVLAAVSSLDPNAEAAVVHGSTVATNALLERRGARTVFVTTAGFADLLNLGRGARTALYSLAPEPLPNLIAAGDVVEAPERIGADGLTVRSLTAAAARRVAERVARRDDGDPGGREIAGEGRERRGVEAAAVCLLFSFLAPEHERRIGRAIQRRAPDCFTSLSVDVLPEFREYERATTTVVNAYVGPATSRYLARMAKGLGARRLSIMGSHGGTLAPSFAAALPVTMVLSGPAAGVTGALAVAERSGIGGVLTFDMGGTSTDVAVAHDGLPLTGEALLGGLPIQRQMVDVHTVGAGGGSLVRVDVAGAVRVGPESAGAEPGPAAYGRGGTAPTLTDAHVVLGRLPNGLSLGGVQALDTVAAHKAMAKIAARIGVSVTEAALIALDVGDAVMEHALRTVSVWRGVDPTALTLLAFGGAGPLHACRLAERLGMRRVFVPAQAGALSALGLAVAAPSVSVSRTVVGSGAAKDLRAVFRTLEEAAQSALAELTGAAPVALERSVDARYHSQSWTLTIPWPRDNRVAAAFVRAHRARYGFVSTDDVVVVTLRVRAAGAANRAALAVPAAGARAPEPSAGAVLDDGSAAEVRVIDRSELPVGAAIDGPAVIVQRDATVWVAAGWRAVVGPFFDLSMHFAGAG